MQSENAFVRKCVSFFLAIILITSTFCILQSIIQLPAGIVRAEPYDGIIDSFDIMSTPDELIFNFTQPGILYALITMSDYYYATNDARIILNSDFYDSNYSIMIDNFLGKGLYKI